MQTMTQSLGERNSLLSQVFARVGSTLTIPARRGDARSGCERDSAPVVLYLPVRVRIHSCFESACPERGGLSSAPAKDRSPPAVTGARREPGHRSGPTEMEIEMQESIERRRVFDTDCEVGRLILGTMTFGAQVELAEAERMVMHSREAGVTMFDSANSYAGGASEEMLGRIVKPFRNEVQLATKVGIAKGENAPLSRRSILREVEGSLRRLQTDYLDVYYLHTPDPNTPFEETLECLDELVRAGKVRHVGQSNFAAWQITEMNQLSKSNGWPRVQVSQQMYNLLARRIEDEYVACSQYHKLFNIAYNPLAGGLLTGKHRLGQRPAPNSRFSAEYYQSRYWNATQFHAVERLRGIAADSGLSLLALSYRWLFSQVHLDCVLVGASNFSHLEANLAASHGPVLDEETLSRVEDVWAALRGAAPAYNR
jgi:aryl-alcohol dehydrogenase-like predicted oxidoreductase